MDYVCILERFGHKSETNIMLQIGNCVSLRGTVCEDGLRNMEVTRMKSGATALG